MVEIVKSKIGLKNLLIYFNLYKTNMMYIIYYTRLLVEQRVSFTNSVGKVPSLVERQTCPPHACLSHLIPQSHQVVLQNKFLIGDVFLKNVYLVSAKRFGFIKRMVSANNRFFQRG